MTGMPDASSILAASRLWIEPVSTIASGRRASRFFSCRSSSLTEYSVYAISRS